MAESIVESSTETVLNISKIGKTRVLHVDDDYAFLKVAKQCLEMQGPFQVDTASSVEEAMEKMKKETYDAVVSDYMMPGKDGLQFLKELRQKGNSIPFIVFTGKGREEVVIKALNLGADHYENKNGNPETVYSELPHDIISAVRTRRAEQELRIQREELQVILDSMPAKIWYKDRNNRLIRVNKAFAEYMGVSKENLEGKPLSDLFPPDIAQKCWEEDKEVFTTGQPKTDILDRHESAQGVRWFSTGKVPCREKDGNIIGTINFSVDITERKKAEEALRESMESYEDLAESISGMFFAMDKDFRYTYWNKASEKFTGISAKDAIGKSLTEVFPDVKGTRVEQFYKEALRTQQPQSYLNKYQLKGKDYVFELNAYPTKTGLSVLVKDVTERKKAEQALEESEDKYRSLVELAPDGIVAVNAEGVVTSVNRSFLTLVGYDFKEVVGKPFTELKSSRVEDIPKFQGMFMSLMKRESPSPVEFLYVRRDGTSRWAEVHPSLLIIDGNPMGAQVIMRDITERKKVEEQLRESEKKYRELFETSIDAIATSDMDGHFIDCNQSCQKMLDYSLDEMKKLTYQQLTPEKWHEKEAEIIEKEVMKKGYTAEYEKELIRKDGAIIPVSNRVWATFDDDGKLKAMWGIVRDISERKKTEQTLRASLERYRSFIEVTGELGWTTNSEGEVVEDVPSFRKFTGQNYEEVKGWGWLKALHPDDVERATEIWKEATRTKSKYETEYRLRRHDGIYRYFMARGVPVFEEDGSIREWVGTCIDITERKVVEDELRSSQERLKIIFESAPDAYYLNDLKGNFIDGNEAAQEITGYDRNELVGKSFLKLKLLPRSQIWKAAKLLALNAAGKPTGPDEFVMTRKD